MPTDANPIPIFGRFPELKARFPRIPLCDLPTPVQPFPLLPGRVGSLHVKRDDLTAKPYGGNKVRKLEFLLGDATRSGAKDVITFGFAGSNHALATALYAGRAGLRVTSMLLPQPNAHYVRRNLLAGYAVGARLVARSTVSSIAATVGVATFISLLRTRRRPYVIPAGGSSPVGVMGYVNAALELAEQIQSGLLPAPDRVYVSLGSMGTTAGLAVGFALAGIQTELHAVRVVDIQFANRDRLGRLIDNTVHALSPCIPALLETNPLESVFVRDEFFGDRYGEFTKPGIAAVEAARESAGLHLDGTYSGKALAALVSDAEQGALKDRSILFWNTHNSHDVGGLGAGIDYHDLPRAFHRYFEMPLQPLDPDTDSGE